MSRQKKAVFPNVAGGAAEELEALNVQTRRKGGVVPMMEATIEATAKKRRRQEGPSSSAWRKAP